MKPIRAVCFDLDDTLLDYDAAAYKKTVACVCDDLARSHHQVDPKSLLPRFSEINEQRWSVSGAAGGATYALDGYAFWRETWSLALTSLGCHEPAVADRALALYVRHRHEDYRLFDDSLTTLEALKSHHKLAVVTNGPGSTQRDKLRFLQLEPYFDVCVISGEVGFSKPDVTIFDHTLRTLGVAADEALRVGDSLSADVAGALGAGMTAVWLNRHGATRAKGDAPVPYVEITSLGELARQLESPALDKR